MGINLITKNIRERIISLTDVFHYNELEINLLTLVYLSIIMFDPSVDDIIEQVLKENYFCFTDDLIETSKKFIPDVMNERIASEMADCTGFAITPDVFKNKLSNVPFVAIKKRNNLANLLDILIHEFKHKMNQVIQKAKYDENNNIYVVIMMVWVKQTY